MWHALSAGVKLREKKTAEQQTSTRLGGKLDTITATMPQNNNEEGKNEEKLCRGGMSLFLRFGFFLFTRTAPY